MSECPVSISIVMPLFNKEREIARAIRSVLAQTYEDYELIIVDDGSTDDGPAIAESFTDSRVRMISQTNAGVSKARNRGILESRADLIAFLDADDEWHKDFLRTIVRLQQRYPQCGVYATRYAITGRVKRNAVLRGLPASFTEGILRDYFLIAAQSDPLFCSSSFSVKRSAIQAIGSFPSGIRSGEDLLTWARLAAQFNIAYSRAVMTTFSEPVDPADRPGRSPHMPDTVAQGLLSLSISSDPAKVKGLEAYLALWHRMRARVLMQLGETRKARDEIRTGLRYSSNMRLYIFFAGTFLPPRFAKVFVNCLSKIAQQSRKKNWWSQCS